MMEILVLSKPKDKLFDPIRQKWVTMTPEEIVRQKLIERMIKELGFPHSLIAVECELSQLPHLYLNPSVPKRRADIIVFAKGIHLDYPLFPLLMIECKSAALTPKFAQQVIGYNTFVQAPFVALANAEQVLVGCFNEKKYDFQLGLPSFIQLCAQTKHKLVSG